MFYYVPAVLPQVWMIFRGVSSRWWQYMFWHVDGVDKVVSDDGLLYWVWFSAPMTLIIQPQGIYRGFLPAAWLAIPRVCVCHSGSCEDMVIYVLILIYFRRARFVFAWFLLSMRDWLCVPPPSDLGDILRLTAYAEVSFTFSQHTYSLMQKSEFTSFENGVWVSKQKLQELFFDFLKRIREGGRRAWIA